MCIDGDEILTDAERAALKRVKDTECHESAAQGRCACRIRSAALMLARNLVEARQQLKEMQQR